MDKRYVLRALIAIPCILLAFRGYAGLIYTPISDCSQLDEGRSVFPFFALIAAGVLCFVLPFRSTMFWKGLVSMIFLLAAAFAYYHPIGLEEHRRDVLGCSEA
jgi:hypothetical protein